MEKLMELAAKRAAKRATKKARKTALKRKGKPAARKSDADLARDLRTAAENYNAALRQKKAALLLLERATTAAQAAGLGVVQEGIRDFAVADEIRFTEISRPL